MKTRSRARIAGAALALTLTCAAAAIGGCGGSSIDPVADAASVTSQTSGAQVAGTLSFASGGQVAATPVTGSFDFRGRRGTLQLDLSKLAALAGGSGAQGTVEERILYPDIYLQAPFLAKALPAGKQWIKIDVQAAAKQLTGLDLTQLTTQSSPADELQQLRASGDAHKVGTEDVRGVSTTHYRGTIDLRKLADRVAASQRQSTQQGIDRLIKLTGTSTIPDDVWIDGQRHVRRVRTSISTHTPQGQQVSFTIALDYFNFGITPTIAAPPADQVFDATGALPGQG